MKKLIFASSSRSHWSSVVDGYVTIEEAEKLKSRVKRAKHPHVCTICTEPSIMAHQQWRLLGAFYSKQSPDIEEPVIHIYPTRGALVASVPQTCK